MHQLSLGSQNWQVGTTYAAQFGQKRLNKNSVLDETMKNGSTRTPNLMKPKVAPNEELSATIEQRKVNWFATSRKE